MTLLWPGQETRPAPQTEYGEYESPKGMPAVLKGALILAGVIIIVTAALFTVNSLREPSANSMLPQSSQPSQSTQPGPSQSSTKAPIYNPTDNEFDSNRYTPADNEFDRAH